MWVISLGVKPAIPKDKIIDEYIPIMLKYLPAAPIVEWVEIHHPFIPMTELGKSNRFELVQDLARLADPELYQKLKSMKDLPEDQDVTLDLLSEIIDAGIDELFYALLENPGCSLQLLIRLNWTYKFVDLADLVSDLGDGTNTTFAECLSRVTHAQLTEQQSRYRIKFLLDHAPQFSLDIAANFEDVHGIVMDLDSEVLLQCLLNRSSVDIQQVYTVFSNYYLTLGSNLARWLLTDDTEFEKILTKFYHDDLELEEPPPVYVAILQDPRVPQRFLVNYAMPKISAWIRHRLEVRRSSSGPRSKELKSWSTLRYWARWGITNPVLFLDPQPLDYIHPFYDGLELLSQLPYSNERDSLYFRCLVRMRLQWEVSNPNPYDSNYLADYINNHPELGEDKVLWRNLVLAGNHFLVTVLMLYSHPAYAQELSELGNLPPLPRTQKELLRLIDLVD
jgi:hypothetical protein